MQNKLKLHIPFKLNLESVVEEHLFLFPLINEDIIHKNNTSLTNKISRRKNR